MGIPGSGKSTLTQEIVNYYRQLQFPVYWCSADDYFKANAVGEYRFDRNKLGNAHGSCKQKFQNGINDNSENVCVIVDNTNVKIRDSQFYYDEAIKNGFNVKYIEPDTAWKDNAFYCSQKNTHGVPYQTIVGMLDSLNNTKKVLKEKGIKIYEGFRESI